MNPALARVLRVVAYIRMSTAKQEDSPERQRAQIVAYAARKGYVIVEWYIDLAIAGDRDDRPAFRRLIADAQAKRFDVILLDEPSRLERPEHPFAFIAQIAFPLLQAGVSVETASSGPMTWDDVAGQVTTVIHAHQSGAEVRLMSRRILDAMAKAARSGSWVGPAPFGYRKVKGEDKVVRLVPGDPLHVEAVRWMFAEYASGRRGLAGVAAELAARGIVSQKRRGPRKGDPLTPQGVAAILRNRAYVGDFTWNKVTAGKYSRLVDGQAQIQPKGKRGRNPEADWIIRPNDHEPLIDRDTFQAVKNRLATNRRRTTPLPNGGAFKLSKMLVCGACGGWMAGFTDNRAGGRKYRCGSYYQWGRAACTANTVSEDVVVRLIADQVEGWFLNPAKLAEVREDVRRQEMQMADPGTRRALERRLADLDGRIDRGNARILELPPDRVPGAVGALRRLEAERDGVRAELEKVASLTRPMEELERIVDGIMWQMRELRNILTEDNDPARVRAVLQTLVTRVELKFAVTKTGETTRTKLETGVIYTPLAEASSLVTGVGST